MDWFERITGFKETHYEDTRARLSVADGRLHSQHSARRCAVGTLETPSLADLRTRAAARQAARPAAPRPTTVQCVSGDVRQLHRDAGAAGATFQVASQFNLLEMAGPDVSPEDGVSGYAFDKTQGPACAIAAGAGTIYRNYLLPVGGQPGQTRERQIDTLQDLGAALGNEGNRLWQMRNGYCMVSDEGLAAIDAQLAALDRPGREALAGRLRVGVHADVEVTDPGAGHRVNQVYCSALPVAYNRVRQPRHWERFARLVLDAAYEATLLAAAEHQHATGRATVYLTQLGGGAFGNEPAWILDAMRRALRLARDDGLEVRLVSHGAPDAALLRLASEFGA